MFTLKKLMGAFCLIAGATTVNAEGIYQLDGVNLADSDTAGQALSTDTELFIHVNNANDFIRIHACGDDNDDDVEADIYATTLNAQGKYEKTGSSLVTLSSTGANIACNSALDSVLPATPVIGDPMQHQISTAGVYAIELDAEGSSSNEVMNRWDISVVSNSGDTSNPTVNDGNLFSYNWKIKTSSNAKNSALTTKVFVLVPGGFPDTNYVWALDLQNFVGDDYELTANDTGLTSPFAGASAPIASGVSVVEKYPTYLSYPTGANPDSAPSNTQLPTLSGSLAFEDSEGNDNAISPDGDTVEESGNFSFTPEVSGTYAITIDINRDGEFGGTGDILLLGAATANTLTTVNWNGLDIEGELVAQADYTAQLQLRVGEYHFVGFDVEVSGGGTNDGLTILQAENAITFSPTNVFWDDETFLSGNSNLPNGVLSSTDMTGSHRHTWGDFDALPDVPTFGVIPDPTLGEASYIDTYAYGNTNEFSVNAVVENKDAPTITSNGASYNALIEVEENTTAVTTVVPADGTAPYTFSLLQKDAGLFSISDAGILTFNTAPLYDTPEDFNTDNDYIVVVQALDNDGIATQQKLTVRVSETVPNVAPTATPLTITVTENNTAPVLLAGTDSDGTIATYIVVASPSNGALTGTAPNLTYTPTADFFGTDSFTYRVNDGDLDSEIVTVSIDIQEDFDADGMPDVTDTDDDNDGISDVIENGVNSIDFDNDGIDNFRDLDSDDDGIPDSEEGNTDFDEDGNANYLDLDSDSDSILDSFEGTADIDDDNKPNYLDLDSDSDGILDSDEGTADLDEDGEANFLDLDSDGDGFSDSNENTDFNEDGISDRLQKEGKVITGIDGAGSLNVFVIIGLVALSLIRRRNKIAVMAIALASLFSLNAQADDHNEQKPDQCAESGSLTNGNCWYLGVGVGSSRLFPDNNGTSWRVSEKNDTGFKIIAGVTLSEHWFSELSYHDMGLAEMTNLNPAITNTLDIKYRSIGVNAGYWLKDRQSDWNIYGKVGLAVLDTQEGEQVDQSHSAQFAFGVGAQWNINENWFARIELDRIDKDARYIGLSISRYFGSSDK